MTSPLEPKKRIKYFIYEQQFVNIKEIEINLWESNRINTFKKDSGH